MLFSIIRYLVACSVCTTWLFSTAMAAPPADCVKKHAGRWQITVRATGQTYPADLLPNGTGVSHCPGCAPGTWTCSGNTSTVFVNGQTVVSTLSPDGRTATSSCCTSTRIGGVPAVASATPDKSVPPKAGRSASDQPTGRRDQTSSKQIAEKSSAPAAAVKSAGPRSTSCSDITGTSSTAPAATHCRDADRSLYTARQVRQSSPQVAAAEYKKAAAAARRAGDNNLELSILREATEAVASLPKQPTEDPCAAPMREAAAYITGAEAIEKNDPSCAGLTAAAENYFTAGKIFFRAVKLDQTKEKLENSCEYKKTNELLLRRDALNDLVDRMRQERRCGSREVPQSARVGPSKGTSQAGDDAEQHKKDCANMREKLKPHAPYPEWIDDQMKRADCNPDGTPMSLRDRLKATLDKKNNE